MCEEGKEENHVNDGCTHMVKCPCNRELNVRKNQRKGSGEDFMCGWGAAAHGPLIMWEWNGLTNYKTEISSRTKVVFFTGVFVP
jgi:hypothetical protein